MAADCRYSLGINKDSVAYISSAAGDPPRRLQEYCGIEENLREDADRRPQFHFYYLPAWNKDTRRRMLVDKRMLFDALAAEAAALALDRYKKHREGNR